MSNLIYLYAPVGERIGTYCPDTGRAQIGDVLLAPERTCRMVKPEWAGPKSRTKACSECGMQFETWLENYCSYCGAKVVD